MASENYDSDEMLNQALDLYEECQENLYFITQDQFEIPYTKGHTEDALKPAVDLPEMLKDGKP